MRGYRKIVWSPRRATFKCAVFLSLFFYNFNLERIRIIMKEGEKESLICQYMLKKKKKNTNDIS